MMEKEKGEEDEAGTRGKKKGIDAEAGTGGRRAAGVGSGERGTEFGRDRGRGVGAAGEGGTRGGTPSKSGKTLVIASTQGNKRLVDEDGNEVINLGMNAYRPR